LQNLPGDALLLPSRGTARPRVLTVECDPQIITLPGAYMAAADDPGIASPVASAGGWPELAPPGQWPPRLTWQDDPSAACQRGRIGPPRAGPASPVDTPRNQTLVCRRI
jgi:hypothetical protein